MMKKPTKKEIEEEIHHLRHVEMAILTLSVTLMVTGLTLYLSIEGNDDLKNSSFLMFIFALFFSGNHIRAIVFREITPRINAFIIDVGFSMIIGVIYVATIITRIILSFYNKYPSVYLPCITLFVAIFILIIGIVSIQSYITKKVIPAIRKKIFPALSYYKHLDNPLIGKDISMKNENKNRTISKHITKRIIQFIFIECACILIAISVFLQLSFENPILFFFMVTILPIIFGSIFFLPYLNTKFKHFSKNLIDDLTDFLAHDFDDNRHKNWWPLYYVFASFVYFYVLVVYFSQTYTGKFTNVLIGAWVGMIFLRFFHFTGEKDFAKKIGKLVVYFMTPFGFVLAIFGLNPAKISFSELPLYSAYFSLSFLFILATFCAEIVFCLIRDIHEKN